MPFLGGESIQLWDAACEAEAIPLAAVGFVSTAVTIVFSLIPSGEETHPALALAKVLGATAVLVGSGPDVYRVQRKKQVAETASAGD